MNCRLDTGTDCKYCRHRIALSVDVNGNAIVTKRQLCTVLLVRRFEDLERGVQVLRWCGFAVCCLLLIMLLVKTQ